MKPICVPCQRFYRPIKNGFFFIEGMPTGNGTLPGKAEPDKWSPYKLWCGDKWQCPDCRNEIISGVGLEPISEHYLPDFSEMVEITGADQLQINDC